jgi:hypothetical protein
MPLNRYHITGIIITNLVQPTAGRVAGTSTLLVRLFQHHHPLVSKRRRE